MPSLLEVPDVAMNLILAKLNFWDIQCLRKSCRDLRHFIDDSKPDSALSQIDVRIEVNYVSLFYRNNDQIAVESNYHANKQGCMLIWYTGNRKHKKLLKNSDFSDIACQDLATVLINQKSALELFNVNLFFSSFGKPENKELDLKKTSIEFLEKLKKILELRSQKLKVQTFNTTVLDHYQISTILQFLDPDYLDSLIVFNVRGSSKELEVLNISEIVELEHWRKMKTLSIYNFVVEIPVCNLTHFERIYVTYKVVTMDMVMELKEAFFRPNSTLQYIELRFGENDALNPMTEIFGPPLEEIDKFREKKSTWFFRIPDSKLIHTINIYRNFMHFNRVEYEKIPHGVVIL